MKLPTTRHQKGKWWATGTLVICAAFSIWANVRSGQMNYESVIVSVMPPIVAFFSSHLIGYFNPTKIGQRILVWGIGGIIMVIAMYGSGWHIYDYVIRTGQHWTTAIAYIFITDAPMLLAAVILVDKVPTAQTTTNTVKAPVKAQKVASPAKATKPPTKRTSPAKVTTPAKTVKPAFSNPLLDPVEKDMLTA